MIVEETLQGIASVKASRLQRRRRPGPVPTRHRWLCDRGPARCPVTAERSGAFVTFAIFEAIVLVMWYGPRLVEQGELTFGGPEPNSSSTPCMLEAPSASSRSFIRSYSKLSERRSGSANCCPKRQRTSTFPPEPHMTRNPS